MENFELYLQHHKEITEDKLKTIDRFMKQVKPRPIRRMSKVGMVENMPIRLAQVCIPLQN